MGDLNFDILGKEKHVANPKKENIDKEAMMEYYVSKYGFCRCHFPFKYRKYESYVGNKRKFTGLLMCYDCENTIDVEKYNEFVKDITEFIKNIQEEGKKKELEINHQ